MLLCCSSTVRAYTQLSCHNMSGHMCELQHIPSACQLPLCFNSVPAVTPLISVLQLHRDPGC